MHSHAGAWERENGQRGYAFPRRSVGTRYGQRRYAFPRRSVGTRERRYAFPRRSVGTRERRYAFPRRSVGTRDRYAFPRWSVGTRDRYAFPRRSVGTRYALAWERENKTGACSSNRGYSNSPCGLFTSLNSANQPMRMPHSIKSCSSRLLAIKSKSSSTIVPPP